MAQYKRTTWWRFDSYQIVGGSIVPVPGARLEAYDPWENFHRIEGKYRTVDAMWAELVETVRRCNELTQKGVQLERRDNEILEWTKKYGLLGLLSGGSARIEMPWRRFRSEGGSELYEKFYHAKLAGRWVKLGTLGRWESLEEAEKLRLLNSPPPQTFWAPGLKPEPTLLVVSRYFRETLSATDIPLPLSDDFWSLYQEPIDEWLNLAKVFAESVVHVSHYAQKKFDHREPTRNDNADAQSALRVLDYQASLETDFHFFGPYVIERRRSAPSLLSILANMFLMDLEAGRRLIRCATCRGFFVSNDRQAAYCKVACRNLAQTRRYRALQKLKKGS